MLFILIGGSEMFGLLQVGMKLKDDENFIWVVKLYENVLCLECEDLMAIEKVKDFDMSKLTEVKEND